MKKTTTKKARCEKTALKDEFSGIKAEFSDTAEALDGLKEAIDEFGKTILEKLQAINKMVEEYLDGKENAR